LGIASIFGLVKLKPLVFMLDDIPHSDQLYQDLDFVQNHFKGVMPFEIIIKTNIEDGIKDPIALNKIYKLQKKLESRPEFSRSLSVVDVVSFANQAWHDGNPKHYRLPNSLDLGEISGYLPGDKNGGNSPMNGLVDKKFSKARVSLLMADVGSEQMELITNEVAETAGEIFPREDFDIDITGTSYIFLKGNQYLVKSLRQSLILAFILIAFIMGALFTSFKMILVSLIPNTIPLILICGIMGLLDVPLKPSTILVFSIAFGIAVDDTIHFLTKFRHEMKRTGLPVKQVLSITVVEMGQSLIYTSVVLFFGFLIFGFSHFEGTVALGLLTATCLLVALFSNLFLLPALILSFEKTLNPKEELEDALIEVDEEN
jgi:predicted RND superfamily exporter protein